MSARPAFSISSIRPFALLLLLFLFCPPPAVSQQTSSGRRGAYLDQLLELIQDEHPERGRVSPLDHTWRDWLERTGELPPDFSELPSLPFLPDPFLLDEGGRNIPVTTMEQWERKKEWICGQVKHWITGTFPPPPDNLAAEVLEETIWESGARSRTVLLTFGPGGRARLTVELLIPPGEGPFPVFMTQWNHRGWALVGLRRGYVGCVYAGADAKDDTEGYADIWYPEYDFTRLMRRAWGAHRAVDYLHTQPFVDKRHIGLTGHSRNGKQSLMAAAFDERITAVISSSGGTGAEDPWRYTSDKYDNETISEITTWFPYWMHPRLRFFIGREHKLPVDQNLLMALVAPRGLMLSSAITEHQGNPWGIERNYRSLERVYRFLGASPRLAIRLRHGRHGTSARDIEAYCDFFDHVFGRDDIEPENRLYYDYSFDRWRELSQENFDPLAFTERGVPVLAELSTQMWENAREDILQNIRWMLGQEPAGGMNPGPQTVPDRQREDYLGQVIGRPEEEETLGRTVVGPYNSFGDYLYGNLYFPRSSSEQRTPGGKLPVVILLHEYAYPTGFARRSEGFIRMLAERGFAVFTYDMTGFGSRVQEAAKFYRRYPHWSRMGRMCADLSSAVEALEGFDFVDSGRIYAGGYSLGATVALLGAAQDRRIDGVFSVCGFTPLRACRPGDGIEGLEAYSHLHGLIPRLGFFTGHADRVPVDFDQVIAALAPRPALIVAHELDRDAMHGEVRQAVERAGSVYRLLGAADRLTFSEPLDYSRFTTERQEQVARWLEITAGK